MRHLLNYSVYEDLSFFGDDIWYTLYSVGCDGLELLTSFEPVDPVYREYAETVHLPYAVDWLAAWDGRPYDFDDESTRYIMYGRDQEEVVDNLETAINCAASVSPAHGVLHAANADIFDLRHKRYLRDPKYVLRAFTDMVNQTVARMPGGEPPFKIVFENLWWPGLRLLDESDFNFLQDRLEFDNWGFCIDTGHMMSSIPRIYTEQDGIEALKEVFMGYSRDLIRRVSAVHFHWSASGKYRESFQEQDMGDDAYKFYCDAYNHVSQIDHHMPFKDPACKELLDILEPTYVIHELSGSKTGVLEDFLQQRSLLD